jgi:hypothetical protein
MSTLRRRFEVPAKKFVEEWRVHGDLVRRLPGVLGYVHNIPLARARDDGGKPGTPTATYADVPIDGVVEMRFP